MSMYEIRRSGTTLCRSALPDLGYSPAILKDMDRHGLHMYCDGKKKKAAPGLDLRDAAQGNGTIPNISDIGGNVNEHP